jgi:hypothetical protein
MTMVFLRVWCCSLLLAVAATARAQDLDEGAPPAVSATATAASEGAFLPLTLGARVGDARAFGFGSGGYDSARHGPLLDGAVEARVWGPIALRAATTYSNDTSRLRPSLGARVQLLRQEAHGVDGSITVLYKAEGFTEAEGEIETVAAFGRRFGGFYLLGNAAYGQDPEGSERDGELRLAGFRQSASGRLSLGLDSRARFALGAQRSAVAMAEPTFDLAAGPVATFIAGPLALFAEAGPSVLRLPATGTRFGLAAIGGVGTAF